MINLKESLLTNNSIRIAAAKATYELCYELLQQAYDNNELIYTGDLRQIGKTTALINFAKERNIPVIVANATQARIHQERYNYSAIFHPSAMLKGFFMEKVLIDEGVSVKVLKDYGIKIAAGFTANESDIYLYQELMYESRLIDAYASISEFAMKKFENIKDRGGNRYADHLINVEHNSPNLECQIVALLHDILEDTDTTEEELKEIGVPLILINSIKTLTKPKDCDYMEYIKKVSCDHIAREVKLRDLEDNMRLTRLKKVREQDKLRFEKYKLAYFYLLEHEPCLFCQETE